MKTGEKTRLGLVLAVALAAFALQGCGEQPQVVRYKQGKYQGKPDAQPWENETFKGNKTEWEKAVKTRNLAQNEYKKI